MKLKTAKTLSIVLGISTLAACSSNNPTPPQPVPTPTPWNQGQYFPNNTYPNQTIPNQTNPNNTGIPSNNIPGGTQSLPPPIAQTNDPLGSLNTSFCWEMRPDPCGIMRQVRVYCSTRISKRERIYIPQSEIRVIRVSDSDRTERGGNVRITRVSDNYDGGSSNSGSGNRTNVSSRDDQRFDDSENGLIGDGLVQGTNQEILINGPDADLAELLYKGLQLEPRQSANGMVKRGVHMDCEESGNDYSCKIIVKGQKKHTTFVDLSKNMCTREKTERNDFSAEDLTEFFESRKNSAGSVEHSFTLVKTGSYSGEGSSPIDSFAKSKGKTDKISNDKLPESVGVRSLIFHGNIAMEMYRRMHPGDVHQPAVVGGKMGGVKMPIACFFNRHDIVDFFNSNAGDAWLGLVNKRARDDRKDNPMNYLCQIDINILNGRAMLFQQDPETIFRLMDRN